MTLEIFEYLEKYDYEQVVFCQDKESGLKAIIAIHDTTLTGSWWNKNVDI